MKRLLSALAAIALTTSQSPSVFGQASTEPERESGVCLTSDKEKLKSFSIIVTTSRADEFSKQGFSISSCPDERNAVVEYRDQLCRLAHTALPPVKESFAKSTGIPSDDLCDMAELIAGKWQDSKDFEERIRRGYRW
jgi:hypothetical protein